MNVSISIDNNKTIIKLPFVTTDMINISYGSSSNENKDSIKYGQIKVLGNEPLATVNISSFFSNGELPFEHSGTYSDPMRYVKFFRDNRKKRKPMRIVITNKKGREVFNRLMALETFEITRITRTGDIYYNLEFEQYRLVR